MTGYSSRLKNSQQKVTKIAKRPGRNQMRATARLAMARSRWSLIFAQGNNDLIACNANVAPLRVRCGLLFNRKKTFQGHFFLMIPRPDSVSSAQGMGEVGTLVDDITRPFFRPVAGQPNDAFPSFPVDR